MQLPQSETAVVSPIIWVLEVKNKVLVAILADETIESADSKKKCPPKMLFRYKSINITTVPDKVTIIKVLNPAE